MAHSSSSSNDGFSIGRPADAFAVTMEDFEETDSGASARGDGVGTRDAPRDAPSSASSARRRPPSARRRDASSVRDAASRRAPPLPARDPARARGDGDGDDDGDDDDDVARDAGSQFVGDDDASAFLRSRGSGVPPLSLIHI